jgi:CheY-like chemotaxis protein
MRPILLVEDNPMDLDLTRRAFAKRKLAIPLEVARDGEEALGYMARWDAGEEVPFVILLDLKIPKVDGLEVLRQIKANPKYHLIPIVVLTSSAEERDIQTAYKMGANSYIVKPVDYEKFLEVANHIDQYWMMMNTAPRVPPDE